jgi:serine/threonine protein kinase/formylglycine-generating enzyme required for sulfatase activity
VAAALTDSRILPLLDLLEGDSSPVLVIPYVEGTDLGRIISDRRAIRQGKPLMASHPWATLEDKEYLAQILPVLDKVIEAVTVIHQAHVVHRDIKPSNVLVDRNGSVWLTDFGLARLGQGESITSPGVAMGSPGFMSPEQWDGRADIKDSTDVFSLGVTLYQALTLDLPYGTTRLAAQAPPPLQPSRLQPLLSEDFDRVVLTALAADREERYQTANQLQEDWRRIRQGLPAPARRFRVVRRLARRMTRTPWRTAGLFLGLLLAAVWGIRSFHDLQGASQPPSAMDSDPNFCGRVQIITEPPGARVVLVPFDENGEPRTNEMVRPPEGSLTPLTLTHVPVGNCLVVADIPGFGFQEVSRTVPPPGQMKPFYPHDRWDKADDGTVTLPTIRIYPEDDVRKGMAYFEGGQFIMGPDIPVGKTASPAHRRTVSSFYLDTTEVSVGAFRRSGLLLPRELGETKPDQPADIDRRAVTYITFYGALDYAEKIGKRLPTEAEYEFAATLGGRQAFPWGDEKRRVTEWGPLEVGQPLFDRTPTPRPIFGLYSNVAEWTDSLLTPYDPTRHPSAFPYHPDWLRAYRDSRVVRGAPPSVLKGLPPKEAESQLGPRWRTMVPRYERLQAVGFRCARSAKPRFFD